MGTVTPASSAFWVYLAAYSSIGGISALVLGVIARIMGRPFDTPPRLRVFVGLLAIVGLMGVIASALSYSLASSAGAFAAFRASTISGPFLSAVLIYWWASGFSLSRVFRRRP